MELGKLDLKLRYLIELRQLIESDCLTTSGKVTFLQSTEAVCRSIEQDLEIYQREKTGWYPPHPQG